MRSSNHGGVVRKGVVWNLDRRFWVFHEKFQFLRDLGTGIFWFRIFWDLWHFSPSRSSLAPQIVCDITSKWKHKTYISATSAQSRSPSQSDRTDSASATCQRFFFFMEFIFILCSEFYVESTYSHRIHCDQVIRERDEWGQLTLWSWIQISARNSQSLTHPRINKWANMSNSSRYWMLNGLQHPRYKVVRKKIVRDV